MFCANWDIKYSEIALWQVLSGDESKRSEFDMLFHWGMGQCIDKHCVQPFPKYLTHCSDCIDIKFAL